MAALSDQTDDSAQGQGRSVHPAAVIGGGLLGLVLNGFLLLVAFLIVWSFNAEGPSGNTGRDLAVMLAGGGLVPLVSGVVVFRRGRPEVGRGFVLGVLVGSLAVGALALSAMVPSL